MAENSWLTVLADDDILFCHDAAGRWRRLAVNSVSISTCSVPRWATPDHAPLRDDHCHRFGLRNIGVAVGNTLSSPRARSLFFTPGMVSPTGTRYLPSLTSGSLTACLLETR